MADRVVIVGAGPAGVRAAQVLVGAGLRPVVIDEAPRSGGQIYRRPPAAIVRAVKLLYGFDAHRAVAMHEAFDRLAECLDYRPSSTVWSVSKDQVFTISPAGAASVAWDKLILATGAIDRIVPFRGWTIPGVYTLGGAQVALKYQACAVGRRPVFFGTGPLLYLVAYQYALAGVRPVAVVDTSPGLARIKAMPRLLWNPKQLARGAYYVGRLRSWGVPIHSGVTSIEAVTGTDGAVAEFRWQDDYGFKRSTACDAVAFGFGLKPETQLAELAGVPFAFDQQQRQWLPQHDAYGRTAVDGVYVAGDGAAVRGAEAAELGGEMAAHALLCDLQRCPQSPQLRKLSRRLTRADRFRRALDGIAFPFPSSLAGAVPDDVMLCRCEGVTAGELRNALTSLGAKEINQAKALCRIGMGRCQGRICGLAAAEVLAAAQSVPVESVGRLRSQPPVKPISIAAAQESVDA